MTTKQIAAGKIALFAKKKFSEAHQELFVMCTKLVKAIDPLRGKGADLQDLLMKCDRMGMGEIPVPMDASLN